MAMPLKIISRKIELTATVSNWDLFDMPDSPAAVEHINKTIVDLIGSGSSRREVYHNIWPVMKSYSHLGATDSEPTRYLDIILDHVYGEMS